MAGVSTKEVQKKVSESPEKAERTRTTKIYIPSVDIIEKKDEIVLFADMPGVDEKNVDITLEKNVLTIYGKVDAIIPEKHRLSLSEYGIGDYHRSFTLTDEVDKDKIQATMKNGVLKLILPKAEAVKTKKIIVKSEE